MKTACIVTINVLSRPYRPSEVVFFTAGQYGVVSYRMNANHPNGEVNLNSMIRTDGTIGDLR
jgi:hypothetical protein